MIQFAPADAARSDTPPPIPTLEEIQTRRKLAEELMRQGSDASPVQHWTQGLARVASALSGRWQMDQAARQSGDISRDANSTLLDLYKPSVTGAGMPAVPQAAAQTAQAPLSDDQQGVADFASGMNTQGLAKALPGKVATALDPSLVNAVKNFEGYAPKASWDYKQNSNGYGTKAQAPGEQIDPATAETRLQAELGKAQSVVENFAPNAPEGVKKALTSLTYNAGDTWTRSGLGAAVQQGDWQTAQQHLLQYNKAGGQTLPGLQTRRAEEAKWMAQQPQQQPTQVADAGQGQGMTRETLSHMLANPLTRDAAQKYILEQANPKKPDSQFGIVREGLDGKTYGWHNDKDQTIREYGGPKPAAGQEPQQTGIQAITQAIKEGKQSPELTNLYRKGGAVREELARQGVDHSKLLLEYASAKKQVQALNSPQMIRFTSLATSVDQTVDELRSLSKEMNNSGLMALNAAKLEELKQLEGNSQRGQLAARYITAANTLKEEFANLAAGGYAPTESAWKLADQQIHANYGVNQLNASLDEIQRLIRYRVNAIPNLRTLGPGADNRYTGYGQSHDGNGGQMPEAPHPAATHVWNPATGTVEAVGGR